MQEHIALTGGLALVHARRREMFERDVARYNGNLDKVVKETIAYMVESASKVRDANGRHLNVFLNLSVSNDPRDDDDTLWKTVDAIQVSTAQLQNESLVDGIVRQLKASCALNVIAGSLIEFTATYWR